MDMLSIGVDCIMKTKDENKAALHSRTKQQPHTNTRTETILPPSMLERKATQVENPHKQGQTNHEKQALYSITVRSAWLFKLKPSRFPTKVRA